MNSVLLDIKDMLNKYKKMQEGRNSYIIQDIKTYYDFEYSLHIALKVYVRTENKTKYLILGIDDLEDLRVDLTDNLEEQEKWFKELN